MKLVGVREEDAEDAEDGRADGGRWLAVFTTEGSSPKEIKSLQLYYHQFLKWTWQMKKKQPDTSILHLTRLWTYLRQSWCRDTRQIVFHWP